jgi:hypothetical protein
MHTIQIKSYNQLHEIQHSLDVLNFNILWNHIEEFVSLA